MELRWPCSLVIFLLLNIARAAYGATAGNDVTDAQGNPRNAQDCYLIWGHQWQSGPATNDTACDNQRNKVSDPANELSSTRRTDSGPSFSAKQDLPSCQHCHIMWDFGPPSQSMPGCTADDHTSNPDCMTPCFGVWAEDCSPGITLFSGSDQWCTGYAEYFSEEEGTLRSNLLIPAPPGLGWNSFMVDNCVETVDKKTG